MGNWCPLCGKKCRNDCVLYRKGFRYFEDGRPPEPFEECAINIATDCLERLVRRAIGQQKAAEQTRNEVNKLRAFFTELTKLKMLEAGATIVEENKALEKKIEEDG